MSYTELDTVVLDKDLPELGLKRGDLGAVVHLLDGETLEVEFVTANGATQALVTLSVDAVRPVAPTDLVAVRPVEESA